MDTIEGAASYIGCDCEERLVGCLVGDSFWVCLELSFGGKEKRNILVLY